MKRSDLLRAVEKRIGSRKTAKMALDAIVDTITAAVARGESVGIKQFGTFERSAATDEATVEFSPARTFTELVADARKLRKDARDAATQAAKQAAGRAVASLRSGAQARAAASTMSAEEPATATPAGEGPRSKSAAGDGSASTVVDEVVTVITPGPDAESPPVAVTTTPATAPAAKRATAPAAKKATAVKKAATTTTAPATAAKRTPARKKATAATTTAPAAATPVKTTSVRSASTVKSGTVAAEPASDAADGPTATVRTRSRRSTVAEADLRVQPDPPVDDTTHSPSASGPAADTAPEPRSAAPTSIDTVPGAADDTRPGA